MPRRGPIARYHFRDTSGQAHRRATYGDCIALRELLNRLRAAFESGDPQIACGIRDRESLIPKLLTLADRFRTRNSALGISLPLAL